MEFLKEIDQVKKYNYEILPLLLLLRQITFYCVIHLNRLLILKNNT